jgi:hypothetical protein
MNTQEITVTVFGPDLRGLADTFEVHRTGCAHANRGHLRHADRDWQLTAPAASIRRAVEADINVEFWRENGYDSIDAYLDDGQGYRDGGGVHYAPCVR